MSMGLKEYGMDYKDLIFGLLADRVNDLLTYHPTKNSSTFCRWCARDLSPIQRASGVA